MKEQSQRTTIHLDSQLHAALRLKAAHAHRSVSKIVNDAVRSALAEDQEDLAALISARPNRPSAMRNF